MKLLFPELLKVFDSKSQEEELQLSIIRRGTSVMYLKYNSIAFLDARNFFPQGGLEHFGQIFGAEVHKAAFPYEFWTDLDSMRLATSWPSYPSFKSSLRPYIISEPQEKIERAITKAINHGYSAFEMIELFGLRNCGSIQNVLSETECPSFTVTDFSSFTMDPELYVESMILFDNLKLNGEIESMWDYLLVYNKEKFYLDG